MVAIPVHDIEAFATAQPEDYQRLLHAIVQTLNAADAGVKAKADCLVFLMTCATASAHVKEPLVSQPRTGAIPKERETGLHNGLEV